jgi:hypothetical protein
LRLRRAGERGEKMAHGVDDQLKPALVGVAVVAGAALLVGAVALVARRRRQARWLPPQQRSAASALVQSAGLAVLRLAARQVAGVILQRLSESAPAARPLPSA